MIGMCLYSICGGKVDDSNIGALAIVTPAVIQSGNPVLTCRNHGTLSKEAAHKGRGFEISPPYRGGEALFLMVQRVPVL